MALTQISTKGIKDGTITGSDLATNIDLVDNQKLRFGTGDDFSIYHDGTNSIQFFDSQVGAVRFRTDIGNSARANLILGAGVDLYYNNSKKLETISTGVKIAGNIRVGNGSNLDIKNDNGSETLAKFINNGAVELYHDNSKKFETTSSGVAITGGITTSGASTINEDFTFVAANGEDLRFDKSDSAFEFNDNFKCVFGNSSDLQIFHNGTNSHIHSATGELDIRSDNFHLRNAANNENIIVADANGAVELYHNNVKQLSTRSDGIEIHAPEGGEAGLYLTADEGDDDDDKYRIVAQDGGDLVFQRFKSSVTAYASELRLKSAGGIQANFDGSKKFETTSGGVTVTGTCTATSFAGDGSSLTGITSQGKNLIINGGMRIHQRGTASYTLVSGNGVGYVVDRFIVSSGSGTIVASQSTTVPAGQGFSNSIKLECTATDSNPNSEGYIQYLPEAQNFYHLAYGTSGAKAITVSFWVKSALAATYGFYYYVPDAGPRVYQSRFTINSANTWEKKTITIPGDTGGSGFNNDNGVAAEIRIYFYSTPAQRNTTNTNSWGTHSTSRIPPGTNLVSSTSNDFFFTGFQIEVGSQATDYDFCSYAKELSYCQRYYWKIATNTYRRVNGYKRHDANSFWEVKSPVPMRTAPSPTLLVGGTFTNFQSNFGTTQTSPVVNEWNTDTGMGLLHVQSTWSSTHATIPSWEGYSIEFSAELA